MRSSCDTKIRKSFHETITSRFMGADKHRYRYRWEINWQKNENFIWIGFHYYYLRCSNNLTHARWSSSEACNARIVKHLIWALCCGRMTSTYSAISNGEAERERGSDERMSLNSLTHLLLSHLNASKYNCWNYRLTFAGFCSVLAKNNVNKYIAVGNTDFLYVLLYEIMNFELLGRSPTQILCESDSNENDLIVWRST